MSEFLNILADTLIEFTKKTQILNRALLKLSVKDLLGDKNPDTLQFNEWIKVIEDPLKKRLERTKTTNIGNVITKLKQVAQKNQSLITMAQV
ncbi:hypothetical protein [Candidatus Lokiarchaeum ossiferum]|uniref:hypothetical protein n=1 Tax=Candidatus Lokiarchaeum ossiferum TaxID=2951803 RepID=UPI00352EB745